MQAKTLPLNWVRCRLDWFSQRSDPAQSTRQQEQSQTTTSTSDLPTPQNDFDLSPVTPNKALVSIQFVSCCHLHLPQRSKVMVTTKPVIPL